MNIRLALATVVGTLIVAAALLSLGAAEPVYADTSAFGSGSSVGSALAIPPAPVEARTLTPSIAATQPAAPSADEVGQLWRRGEYLGAGILGLLGLLVVALRVDRERALYYTAGIVALGGCVELIHAGQTPNVSMLVGAGVVFAALITRSPLQPKGEPVRPPERGSIRGFALVMLATIAIVWSAGAAASCSSTQRGATAGAVVDCTLVAIGNHARELEAAIRAGDWTRVRALVGELGVVVAQGVAVRSENMLAGPRRIRESRHTDRCAP